MNELAFADAVRPKRCVVLKLMMLPYSIGHEIILFEQRNALVMQAFDSLPEHLQINAIIRAANICSQDWRDNHFVPKTLIERLRHNRIWHQWDKATRNSDWKNEIAAFKKYRQLGSVSPFVTPADNTAGREMGAPFHASLIQFLVQKMGIQEVNTYDYPLSLAKFHYYTAAEDVGSVKILNENESDFEEYCKRQDDKSAMKKETCPA